LGYYLDLVVCSLLESGEGVGLDLGLASWLVWDESLMVEKLMFVCLTTPMISQAMVVSTTLLILLLTVVSKMTIATLPKAMIAFPGAFPFEETHSAFLGNRKSC
jgi:hypothetical protein